MLFGVKSSLLLGQGLLNNGEDLDRSTNGDVFPYGDQWSKLRSGAYLGAITSSGYHYGGGTAEQRGLDQSAAPDGSPCIRFWAVAPNTGSSARVQLNIYRTRGLFKYYIRKQMWFTDGYALLKQRDQSFTFMTVEEHWTPGRFLIDGGFPHRVTVSTEKPSSAVGSDLHWSVTSQKQDYDTRAYTTRWNVISDKVVEFGKWVTVETWMKIGVGVSGRFALAIDGATLIDEAADTTNEDAPGLVYANNGFNPIKLYTSAENVNHVAGLGGVLDAYYRNLVIYQGWPRPP